MKCSCDGPSLTLSADCPLFVCVDLVTHITPNHATTSYDDVFGVLCFIWPGVKAC